MLKILHTADWHLGYTSRQLRPDDATKLGRARLKVIDTILGFAHQRDVHAVLCAGDLFDSAAPDEKWWRGLADAFGRRRDWSRPVILLPGNHDPLTRDSVYAPGHAFRRALPSWVHVVDRDDFELALTPEAVVYAAPCRSTAGATDLALYLPARAEGDERIRIGLVHGSTFDIPGYQTHFPISRDAPRDRGLDYLAIGDTHAFREVPEGAAAPILYPSAPEPTNFKEREAGYVAIVSFRRRGVRPTIHRERVAQWTWRDETVRTIGDLRKLADEDLASTVLRVHLDMTISISEQDEVEAILESLEGTVAVTPRAGACVVERKSLRIEVPADVASLGDAPESVREVDARLREEARTSEAARAETARRALLILHRLLRETR
ncbi:MAG: DNA repair exonuclease [Candidatus Rokubacteria bacterium]|nr:DNA repair exonuclease [Candidatus Rokubacteria bacterium]